MLLKIRKKEKKKNKKKNECWLNPGSSSSSDRKKIPR